MPYRTWADDDVLNAADLNAMTADALQGYVSTEESLTATTYGDLTTVGPAVTLTLAVGQGVLVWAKARAQNDAGTSTAGAVFSYAVSGASTQGASDDYCCEVSGAALHEPSLVHWFIASATGSHTFTMKYKRSGAVGNAVFRRRRIIVKKF